MDAYKKYLTISEKREVVLSDLPFSPGQRVEVIIIAENPHRESEIATLQKPLPQIDAIVASVSDSGIVLNKGTDQDYQKGMIVSIGPLKEEVKDPETGEILRKLITPVAEARLTDVDDKSSLGQIVTGKFPEVGNIARPIAIK